MLDAAAVLDLAADLERRDRDAAEELERVTALTRQADDLRSRAGSVTETLASAPAEIAALDRGEAQARDLHAVALADEAAASAAVARARSDRRTGAEAVVEAEHALGHASEAVAAAESRLARLVAERSVVVETEAAARVEATQLIADARRIAALLHDFPRLSDSGRGDPPAGLEEAVEWGGRVHAALFVVRGQLEVERDRLVREASELGRAALGEEVAGSSVSLVRRRLEAELRR